MRNPLLDKIYCLKFAFTKLPAGVTKFFIFGRGRSGSTLLVDILNGIPELFCDGEIFANGIKNEHCTIHRRISLHPSKFYGFKVLGYQLYKSGETRQMAFLDYLQNNGFQMIYLRRENLVKHAISNIRARNFTFHSKMGTNENKMMVNPNELLKWVTGSEKQYQIEKQIIARFPHVELIYERNLEQINDQQATLNVLSNFLGTRKALVQTKYKKISPNRLLDSIENYDEIEMVLKNTPYNIYLNDD